MSEHYRSEPGYCMKRDTPYCRDCVYSDGPRDCAGILYRPGHWQPGDRKEI